MISSAFSDWRWRKHHFIFVSFSVVCSRRMITNSFVEKWYILNRWFAIRKSTDDFKIYEIDLYFCRSITKNTIIRIWRVNSTTANSKSDRQRGRRQSLCHRGFVSSKHLKSLNSQKTNGPKNLDNGPDQENPD